MKLKVKSGIKGGAIHVVNHNRLAVRSGVKAGGLHFNHSRTAQ